MSSRLYPIYQRGNPQLRVFLPDFWMKLVKPKVPEAVPKNKIEFQCHMGMSRLDVRNYLQSIYGVPVVSVRVRIAAGKTRIARNKGYVVKDDDYKVAYVTLPKDTEFTFPDLFPKEKKDKELEDEKKHLDELTKSQKEFIERKKGADDIPGWFV